MRNLLMFGFVLALFQGAAQDTLITSSKIDAAQIIYGQLDPEVFNFTLIDRSFSSSVFIHDQVRGNYDQIHDAYSWMEMYSDISLSYTDTNLIASIPIMGNRMSSYFDSVDIRVDGLLTQPFALLLHNTYYIDSINYFNGSISANDNNQLIATVPETGLYNSFVLKSVAIVELEANNGHSNGVLHYHPNFISTSADIFINAISIDVGNGFQSFGADTPLIYYDRRQDSTVAAAAINYSLNDSVIFDTLFFYLVTDLDDPGRGQRDADPTFWNQLFSYDGEYMDFSYGILYSCDNVGGLVGIKRPIIFVPPYRPSAQFYVTLNTYWEQFGFADLFIHLSEMGYDVIFLKEHSGHESIELAGLQLAEFIKEINEIKFAAHPTEAWENIVIGFSAGGQHARYALMHLEKEHMQNGGPHHHTRLYIPFDSPHWGGNVPMFTQSVYKDFSNESLVAWMPWLSLNDEASVDMLFWHYNGSNIVETGGGVGEGPLIKTIYPGAHDNRLNLVSAFNSDFIHQFTVTSDTRKVYPSFTRNVAISTGSYVDDYEAEYGLTSGMLLFKQNGVGLPVVPPSVSFINRKLYSSQYSSSESQLVFKRKDTYFTLGIIPWGVDKEYRTMGAWEWDNAQGGYKTEFYQGVFTGAAYILRSNSLFLSGDRLYKDEVMFMPLVSALGINPTIWANNNLYYNLQVKGLMYNEYDTLDNVSDIFGYPHIAHPTNHFQITPFEAVFADPFTYDHIKMQVSVDEYNLDGTYLVYLRNFICDEVEGLSVFLQNKIIGNNHVQTNPNYVYHAWYKARNEIVIGRQVTPKTDIGDYIIESTGNITVYAGNAVIILPGFHAQAGSEFHAYIDISECDVNYGGRLAEGGHDISEHEKVVIPSNSTNQTDKETNQNQITIYPNPNDGSFVFQTSLDLTNATISIFNLTGQQVYTSLVTSTSTRLELELEKGVYLVVYQNGQTRETIKMVIQ